MSAGPLFNFALSILIFAGFFMIRGVATEEAVVDSLKPTPFVGQSLLPGDRILALDETETPDLAAFVRAAEALPPAAVATYTVERGGARQAVEGRFPSRRSRAPSSPRRPRPSRGWSRAT